RLLRLVRCGSSPRPLHRPVGPRTLAASPPCQPRRALCIVARRMAAYSVGIDVGGTFTDCFVTDGVHGWRGKAPTTPRAPLCGLLAALEDAAAAIGVPLARALGDAVHLGPGTTVVTNCLAELAGAPTGLLVTVVREYGGMPASVLGGCQTRSCAAFLAELEARLAAAGLRVPAGVMQSSGGTLSPAAARARPILLAQSGPVAGVAAAEALAA